MTFKDVNAVNFKRLVSGHIAAAVNNDQVYSSLETYFCDKDLEKLECRKANKKQETEYLE
jgi:hypothetical protein